MVDIAPADPDVDVACGVADIERELRRFSPALAAEERWLVLNKADLLEPRELARRRRELVRRLAWEGRVYTVSALTGAGCKELAGDIMTWLESTSAQTEDLT